MLWSGIVHWTIATETLRVLDQLLIVLMVVEILHTVRISIRSHILLATEPFLVVGLIASIRRVLVISMQMSTLTNEGKWSADGASIFRASMIELALLVVLVLVLVFSIYAFAPLRSYSEGTDGESDLRGRLGLAGRGAPVLPAFPVFPATRCILSSAVAERRTLKW